MKIYRTGMWNGEIIQALDATKVTKKYIWLTSGKFAKRGKYRNYWDTIEEAKEHLIEKYNKQIKKASLKISAAKDDLETLNKYY